MSALRTVLAHLRLLRPRRVGAAHEGSSQGARAAPSPQPSPGGRGGRKGGESRVVSAKGARFSVERLTRLRALLGAPDDGILPPIAVQLLAAPLHLELLGDADFPLRAMGLVHVSNTLEEHRALPDALALDVDAFVEGVVRTPRGDEVTLVTEARVEGELVYRARTVALQKAKRRASSTEPRTVRPEPECVLLRRTLVEVPGSMGRRYASVAGDLNPIHQHAWLARPFGFSRAIVHGTWTLSRALELARVDLPRVDAQTRARTIECTFRRPVLLPSTVAVEVRRAGQEVRLRVVSPDDARLEHLSARVF